MLEDRKTRAAIAYLTDGRSKVSQGAHSCSPTIWQCHFGHLADRSNGPPCGVSVNMAVGVPTPPQVNSMRCDEREASDPDGDRQRNDKQYAPLAWYPLGQVPVFGIACRALEYPRQ